MEVLDTTIANVVLPYIAGGMGVSDDEASWVVTTYLVANAVSLTASPFLARRLGRKTFFLDLPWALQLSSLLCAQALESRLAAPVPHPAGPGRRRHGAGLAIDPGGLLPAGEARPGVSRCSASRWLSRRWSARRSAAGSPTISSWRWCFLINGPVGARHDRADRHSSCLRTSADGRRRAARFDLIGFLLVATFLGALEVVLDRGLEDDWFGSNFIVAITAVICALAFVLMIPWEMSQAQSDDRRAHGGVAPVRRLLPGDGGDRRDPLRDHPVPAAAGADGLRLHRHLGRPRAVAGRPRHHGDDVRGRQPIEPRCSRNI